MVDFLGGAAIEWFFNTQNATLISGWGFILSAVGLLVSIFGFAYTLVQVSLTKKAAEAAKEASDEARTRVAVYDVAAELSRASSALAATRDHIKREDWSAVVEGYADARISLAKISEFPSIVSNISRSNLSDIAGGIERSTRRIASALGKGEGTLDRMKILHAHAEYEVAVTAVASRVDRTK